MKTKQVVTNALMLALLIVSAQLTIPIQPVPISLQTLMVMIIGILLSPTNAFITLLGYTLLGLIGLPVFAGFSGGISSILSPSFGFILSWLIAAPVQSYLVRQFKKKDLLRLMGSCLLNFFITYAIGLTYMAMILNAYLGNDLPLTQIFMVGLIPFIPGDLVKVLVASLLGRQLYPLLNSSH